MLAAVSIIATNAFQNYNIFSVDSNISIGGDYADF